MSIKIQLPVAGASSVTLVSLSHRLLRDALKSLRSKAGIGSMRIQRMIPLLLRTFHLV